MLRIMASYAVAVDLGGTKIAAAVVDAVGAVRARRKAPVNKDSVEATVLQARQLVSEALAEAALDWPDVLAAGVAVPGICFPSGEAWAPNLWGWDRVPLGEALEARLPAPAVIDSDRSAYVLGEHWLGAARGLSDVVFLAVGTGIGAGILTGGRVCRGAQGIAGAVGWFALNPHPSELYSKLGCFEAEAAGPALARRVGAASAEQVVAAAKDGDAAARAALDETAGWLAMGVANLISLLNPEMVVLGGGLMQAGGLLLEPVRRRVLDWAQPVAARQARIELTQLGEDAGLLGAARLAFLHSTGDR